MNKLKKIMLNNKGKIFLLVLAILAIFLFLKGTMLSAEYNARLHSKISVVSTVTDIQEKTRTEEISFEGGDGVEFQEYEETYYKIETKYEYNGKLYNYAFYVDSLTENSNKPVCIGEKISIQIDSKNPEYVFAGDPGKIYRTIGYIIGAILVVIMFFWLLIKFFPNYLFSLPFLIGAVISFCAGISMIILGEAFGYLITFLIAPVFTGVSLLFFKISKMK